MFCNFACLSLLWLFLKVLVAEVVSHCQRPVRAFMGAERFIVDSCLFTDVVRDFMDASENIGSNEGCRHPGIEV